MNYYILDYLPQLWYWFIDVLVQEALNCIFLKLTCIGGVLGSLQIVLLDQRMHRVLGSDCVSRFTYGSNRIFTAEKS